MPLSAPFEVSLSIQSSLSESWILEPEETKQAWKHFWRQRGDRTLCLLPPLPGSSQPPASTLLSLASNYLFIYLFLATLRGMRDLSSPTRDRTCCPLHWKHGVLTTGPPGKSLLATSTLPSSRTLKVTSSEWPSLSTQPKSGLHVILPHGTPDSSLSGLNCNLSLLI